MGTTKKEPNKRYYDKERNRFMKLRYDSDTAEYPNYTANDLAKEFGYSKATISSLENPKLDEATLLGKSVGLLKKYHDKFGCSYEYLIGESKLPELKYGNLDDSPLSSFDSKTLNNLEQMLSDEEFADFNLYMLEALLAEPAKFQSILNILFRYMYVLNDIYANPSHNQAEKELRASNYWYTLNTHLDTFLRDCLLPHLHVGFERYNAKQAEIAKEQAEREKEEGEKAIQKYENIIQETDAPVIATCVNVKVIKDGQ